MITATTEKKSRKNHFEEKRLTTFTSLGTKNTEWVHAKVINFTLNIRKMKSGKLIEEWLPVYAIPDGFENPLDKDVLSSKDKRCQLCDTKLVKHGILLHEEKKIFLVVGLECYEVYEGDDDRELKLKLLQQLQHQYIQEKITIQKDILVALLKEKVLDPNIRPFDNTDYYQHQGWYSVYSTINRARWMGWSRTKFSNWLNNHAYYLATILGYETDENLVGAKNRIKYWKYATSYKTRYALYSFCKEVCKRDNKYFYSDSRKKFGYYVKNINTNQTIDSYLEMCNEEISKAKISRVKEIFNTDIFANIMTKLENWKVDKGW
jgi:hypothetical protein